MKRVKLYTLKVEDVNNAKELDKLRDKYKEMLTDENNKKIMPHFFSHISRQKGYYNPEKKNYCKYHTTMDYVQTIVNGFKVKNPYKKDWLPLVSILDNTKYRTSDVNYKQIEKIYSLLRKHISDRKNIFGSDIDKDDKFLRAEKLYSDLVCDIETEIIGFSTMYYLLQSLENKENVQIKNILFQILFMVNNKSFNTAIIQSKDDINQIEEEGNALKMYGIGYKIAKKKVNSEMEDWI